MAAACTVTEGTDTNEDNVRYLNNDLLDAHIVAQAITELQEIQGPVVHLQNSGDSQLDVAGKGQEVQTITGSVEPTETHVIYYIDSNGQFSGSIDKTYTDSSVQANDYDIERRSGRVPARKRIIPSKFRDYKNVSNDEDSDSDFDPHEYTKKIRISKPSKRTPPDKINKDENQLEKQLILPRPVGRPRKNFLPLTTAKGNSISPECFNPPTSAEVERKLEEAEMIVKKGAEGAEEGPGSNGSIDTDGKVTEAEDTNPEFTAIGKRGRGRPRGPFWKMSYKCPDCGKIFNQRANLRVHLLTHTLERPYPCVEEGCSKRFRSNEGLRRHLLSHQGIKPFECDVCQNRFTSHVALKEHKARHSNTKPYQCAHCEKRFRQVSCYRRHIATHSDRLPYQCTICQRQFAQPAYLRSHMKVHTGEKPYKCEVCDKRFAHQSDVKRHRTTHTGEKPYSCSKCQARFTDVSSKNRHEKEHENAKRHTCHLCSDTFKRPGQLRAHLDRRHGHTLTFSIQESNNTTYFKMDEDNDKSGSVVLNERRIFDIIKNFRNKGNPGLKNISVVGLPETSGSRPDGSSLGTDISQLEREVDASVIEGEVGIPVELHGVEVQAEDADHTYITISDYTGAWSQADKTETTQPGFYQKVQVVTEDGEKKELLLPFNPDNPDDIQVGFSNIIDQPADIVTVNTEPIETSTVDVIASTITLSDQISDQTQSNKTTNDSVDTNSNAEQTNITQDTFSESHQDLVNDNQICVEGDDIERVTVESIILDNGSIVSITENYTELSENDNKAINEPGVEVTESTIVHEAEECIENAHEVTIPISDVQGDTPNDPNCQTCIPEAEDKICDTKESSIDKTDENSETNVVDFVANPDFSSQDYYDWLSKFTELCKVVPMPLDVSLFQKISQVHKTLSDVMANPSGVVADRDNFTVLMNISKELSTIINEHLVFVLDNLNQESNDNTCNSEEK